MHDNKEAGFTIVAKMFLGEWVGTLHITPLSRAVAGGIRKTVGLRHIIICLNLTALTTIK